MQQSQAGTAYLWMMIQVFMVILVAMAIFAVAPAYLNDRIVNSQIEELMQKEPKLALSEFADKADKRFEINTVRDLKFADIAKAEYDARGDIKVMTNYSVRKHFLHNIYFVIHFEKTFEQNQSPSKAP